MKKILYSASAIVAVAAMVLYSTGAFFSDTETSTGNVFTAGAIDLKVDSHATYNGQSVPGSTWTLKDLNPTSDKFFDFADIKPGDSGEDTISLHVINNDAWVCASVANLTNLENGQTEPEALVDTTTGTNEGELQQKMDWVVWRDDGGPSHDGVAGDNIHQPGEQILASGHPVNGTLPVYDSTTGTGPLTATSTAYLGVSWSLPIGTGNEVQTDSMTGNISFEVVQSRNNGQFVCGQSQTERPVVGAKLSDYRPTDDCNVSVPSSQYPTIQAGVNGATPGQTVCVADGVYGEDVVIDKPLTLAGDGASATSVINGQGTGWSGAVSVASGVDNVTIEGFEINGAGVAAVYLIGNNDNVTVRYNRIVAAAGKNALLSGGQQTNSTLSNNVFEGNATGSQLVYVNGSASLGSANASNNVDFLSNTFAGSGNLALGQEAGNSDVKLNKFSTVTSYTDVEAWATGILVNQNNFNESGLMVQNSVAGTLNAKNNWWGDLNPADNVGGTVDFTPSEASAFPQN